ncbi:MAG TPA: GNAT family N-acetyltransferase [Phytomonospora sp.]
MSEPTLTDGLVTLSPLRPGDAEAHFAGEDDALVRWLNGGRSTLDGVRDYIDLCVRRWAELAPHRAFGVRVGPELAGTVDVQFALPVPVLAPGQVNLAYGLYAPWRGRGIATRAVALACAYAAGEGATQAVIRADPGNPDSSAVARRCGFAFQRTLTEPGGERLDWFVRDLP